MSKIKRVRETVLLTVLVVIYVALNVFMQITAAMQISISIGEMVLPFSSFNGILQSLQFMLCLIMVIIGLKKGVVISSILMAVSFGLLVMGIVRSHELSSLPGAANMIISYLMILMLARQLIRRQKETYTDFLTGLRNRRGLTAYLDKKTSVDKPFYVAYIDLENFKYINDNLGHRCGDIALKQLSERMTGIIGDDGVLSRIGGDEFVLVLSGDSDPKYMCERIIEKLGEKIPLSTGETVVDCYVSAYAGIVKYPDDTRDPDTLIRYADIAMYQSMKNKTKRISVFDGAMEDTLARQMELERIIKASFENDYFFLVYQPQYYIKGKKLRGFETLLRLKTGDGTMVSPGEFIPVAEKTGIILKIDDYVLRRAMREFREPLRKAGNSFVLSINVSAKNIGSPDFADRVKAMIKEYDFPPQCLEIEMTEYCLAQSMEITINNITSLREIGVQVALDDFGTGYTSLSYVSTLPINLLKIDKSLIDGIEESQKSRDFVQAVVSMGHLMGCEVISEGVESEPQLEVLDKLDCDFVQGYVWGRPLPYNTAVELTETAEYNNK